MATCNSADSILEAASLIKSNGTKLNTFVNGTSSQTVQLGTGSPTPTLRKFIADAQSVVTQAALDAGQTVLDDVAQNTQDIEDLQSSKADKFVPAEPGNLAKLNAFGNLCDSGWEAEDFVRLLTYTNSEALELEWQVRTSMDMQAVEVKAKDLDASKADKLIPAEAGNLAKLDSTGNLRDSGKAAEDFVELLGYTNNEAVKLTALNNISRDLNETKDLTLGIVNSIQEIKLDSLFLIAYVNRFCLQHIFNIRTAIKDFNESYIQHRLQLRLFNGTNPTSASKPVLFVISGQSNGVGFGNYTPFDRAVDCGQFWSWRDGANELKPLADPIGHKDDKGSGWCEFARMFFALTGRKVILLNLAYGGAMVTANSESNAWNTWADDGYGVRRSWAQGIWDAFSTAVPASSYDIGALLWVQGENDVLRLYANTITVQDYIDGTLDVFDWFRTLVGDDSMPVFFGKIGYQTTVDSDASLKNAYKVIQKAQDDMCNNTDIFMGFSMAPYFLDARKEYMSDGIHYSHYGYKVYGDSFARSVAHYLNF